jgi:hypothetical protein
MNSKLNSVISHESPLLGKANYYFRCVPWTMQYLQKIMLGIEERREDMCVRMMTESIAEMTTLTK